MTQHVVMFSGGAASWLTAKRVVEREYAPGDYVTLLFADTMMEDEDLYRFLDEAAANVLEPIGAVGGELYKLQEGRDPWEVFFDERYLGNTRIDPCSKILKRQLMRKHLEANFKPEHTVVYLGLDWTEGHRFDRAAPFWEPWVVKAPLQAPPHLDKEQIVGALATEGIAAPRLYAAGFPHNNCGGFCIKAGQAHFKLLLSWNRERYLYHERREQELREYLDKDIAILRDRTGGKTRPLTLRELRRRVEAEEKIDEGDWGGCGCFSPTEPYEAEATSSASSSSLPSSPSSTEAQQAASSSSSSVVS